MAKKTTNYEEGSVLHFGAVRLRVVGSGSLRSTLYSLNEVRSDALAALTMSGATDTEPVLIANFTQQRAYLDVRTTAIDEVFNVSKIVIFVKQVATGYPQ